MLFGHLNRCLTLREIAFDIDQSPEFLGDIDLSKSPAKSTLSDGNAKRNYRVFEELYYLYVVITKSNCVNMKVTK